MHGNQKWSKCPPVWTSKESSYLQVGYIFEAKAMGVIILETFMEYPNSKGHA
jgi:hypothetical protein